MSRYSRDQVIVYSLMWNRHRVKQSAFTGNREDHDALGPIIQANWNGHPHDTFSLQYETNIPRTTLQRQVLRLCNAGIVNRVKRGRAIILQVGDSEWDRIMPVSDDAIDDFLTTARLIEEMDND